MGEIIGVNPSLLSDQGVRAKARRVGLKVLLSQGIKSAEDVELLINLLGEPVVGRAVNCGKADHVAPFTFLKDVLTGGVGDFIVHANRAGSKSYYAGLITWAKSSTLAKHETMILGASLEQSEKAYKAMTGFWGLSGLQNELLFEEPSLKRTSWRNGSLACVLTASTKSVRGPHPQALLIDEVDEIEEEVYKSALSQPQSKFGHPASLGRLSTWHRSGGMMEQAISKAIDSSIPIYRWCIWECLESCRDYSCSTCKLSALCPGQQMKAADGYYKIVDFEQKLRELSDNALQTEWNCEKPGKAEGLVYGEYFDLVVHSPLDLPGYDPTKRVYLSVDWGGTHPFSVGVWQKFPRLGWVRVEEIHKGHTTNSLLLAECKTKAWWRRVVEGVADPSRADLMNEWRAEGISMYPADNAVDEGIEAVRASLKPVHGNPLFFVNRKCKACIREFENYEERNRKPVKEKDDAMDELRYFIMRHVRPATARARIRAS